jgi:PAS domain S-box-containing protein
MLLLFEGVQGPRDTLRFIEEKIGVGVWTWDLKTRKMDWSPGFFRLLGFEPGSVEPSYSTFLTMVHPDDRRPQGEMERILSEGGSIEREFRVLQNNGRVRSILKRGNVLFDRAGKPVKAIGVVFDVTRLHEALSIAEALKARYSSLVEATAAIVWTVNADGTVGDIPLWRKFTGQGAAAVAGDGWLSAIHPDDQTGVKVAWDSGVANRVPYEFQCRVRRFDCEYRWVRARSVPVFKKDGSLREWVGICVDVHDQKLWSPPNPIPTITGAQLRAARAILTWSVRDLVKAAAVSSSTIRRLEESDGPTATPDNALTCLKTALEKGGVEFLFPPVGKAGARPR